MADWPEIMAAFGVPPTQETEPPAEPVQRGVPGWGVPCTVRGGVSAALQKKRKLLAAVRQTSDGGAEIAGLVFRRRNGAHWVIPTELTGCRITTINKAATPTYELVARAARDETCVTQVGVEDPSSFELARRGWTTTAIAFYPDGSGPQLRSPAVLDVDPAKGRDRYVFSSCGGYPSSVPLCSGDVCVVPIKTFVLRIRWTRDSRVTIVTASWSCTVYDIRIACRYLALIRAPLPCVTVLLRDDVPASLQMALPTGCWTEVSAAGVFGAGFGLRLRRPDANLRAPRPAGRAGNLAPQRLFF